MTSRAIAGSLLLVSALFLASCSDATDEVAPGLGATDTGPSSNEIAPIFAVDTADGGQFSLSEHLAEDGRPVFLNLWASWCFPCREEMPAIDEASRLHPEVAFIGVAVQDSRSDAEDFVEEIGVSYTIGFDDEDAVDDGYAPLGLPASYIISSDGVILERIFGKVTQEDLTLKFAKHFG